MEIGVKMDEKKALIIGGSGFVGNYLTSHLKNELKWNVYVTKTPHEEFTYDIGKIFDMDILDKVQISEVLEKVRPDYIFHLAAQSSVAMSWKNPGLTIDINIKGSINVMDAIRELNYKPRMLFVGSGEEYGHISIGESPITETNAVRPGNIYAATKVCQNMIGKIYADAYDMGIMMVRAFNHIGPNQSPIFVVADFCKQVAEIERGVKEPVIYTGNLTAKRDFTDVRDVVRAYGLLIQKGKKGETYNIGSGNAVSIQEIVDKILRYSKTKIKIEIDLNKLRPVDVPIIEADISKVRLCTGWKPEIDIDTTLTETLDYWRRKIVE